MTRRALGRSAIYAILAACAFACGGTNDPGGSGEHTGRIRVLFIGNSLTYTNSLPQMVDALAKASGFDIVSDAVTFPGAALIDQWNDPFAREKVQAGHYDVVILQQGPSSLEVNRDSLRMWTALWAPEIRAAGGRPALYAVWPDASRRFAFADVSTSYRLAADDVNGIFFPVGDTWVETWNLDPNAGLYGPDDFHPSVAGTYAAAVVIVAVLGNREATLLASDFIMPQTVADALDPQLANTIRRAAQTVISRNRVPIAQ